jgi:hypothetical protein
LNAGLVESCDDLALGQPQPHLFVVALKTTVLLKVGLKTVTEVRKLARLNLSCKGFPLLAVWLEDVT